MTNGAWKYLRIAMIAVPVLLAGAGPSGARVIDGVVAVVNDEPVTLSEVREAVSEGVGIPAGDADQYLRQEREAGRILQWISMLVDAVLVRQELVKQGQAVGEKEVDRAVASVREQNKFSEADFTAALAREGLTVPAFRRRIRSQMERGAIVRALRMKEVIVTEDEVRAYFKENADRFLAGAEVRLETLHLPYPEGAKGEEQAVPVRIAMQQSAFLVRGGVALSEAAKALKARHPAVSVATSGFLKTDDLLPEIRKEIGKLRTGESSPPFYAESGGYIVKVLERRGGTPPDYPAVKENLMDELTDRRSEKALVEVLDTLRRSATVDVRL